MSEVQSRPVATRGRGSGRGGRGGGHSTRGGARTASNRTAATTNGDSKNEPDSALPTLDDEGEVGQLNKQYGSKVPAIKEMFPTWSDVDILFALKECDGDAEVTVMRILEGTVQQWGEVSKPKKERVRPKAKNDTFTTTTADSVPRTGRGGRVGTEGGRGRGRATERGGRGGGRGKASNATTNGTRNKESTELSVPTEESSEWDNVKPAAEETSGWGEPTSTWETPAAAAETAPAVTAPTAPVAAPKPVDAAPAPKTWASMLRQSTAPKTAPKPKEAPAPKPEEPVIEPLPPVAAEPVEEPQQPEEEPVVSEEPTPEPAPVPVKEPTPIPPAVPIMPTPAVVPEVALVPSKDQLTETNLEQIADVSHPPETETAASEAADSWDPRGQAASATATPISASQQQHQASRTPTSGFAATASKAADRTSTRTPQFPRQRVLDQLEPVRMPGNRDQVERTAVQFGAFSLNEDEDVDGDREEPETRPQPPADSPVTHPRTSLPPAQPAPVPETFTEQKPTTSLPPTGPAAAAPPTAPTQPAAAAQASQPAAQNTQQYGRFGQPAPQEPTSFPSSKPFDSFAQQQPGVSGAQNQYDGGFPSQAQSAQPQGQQQPGGAFSSAPSEFSSYYTADPQSRYNNYYNNQNFGQQQAAQGQQDGLPGQQGQRSFGSHNAPQADNLSQYPQSGSQYTQGRYGSVSSADVASTPATAQSATPAQTAQAGQSQSHGQQPQHDGYGYGGHPYYNNPYYSAYMGGYQQYNQGAYGAPYGGNKGGLGYQPTQYGMSPQAPHGYASSPAGGFGQSALHRDSGVGAGLGDYGRAASGQTGQQQAVGAGSFGSMHDSFGRGGSGYQSGAGQSFSAPGTQPGAGPSAADDLKPFGDAKAPAGPSPAALGAAARPGSAANNVPSQTGLPPPQSSQQGGLGGMGGYGYPSHLTGHGLHGNQSGAGGYGMSASGGQGHQNSYAGYGGQGFSGSYYSGNPPRGWGNNYH